MSETDATPSSLAAGAAAILATAAPAEKIALSRTLAAAWREGRIGEIGEPAAPDEPARPARPLLLPPREMPKRRAGGSPTGRVALLHALAHIELNAIDLAWDIVARFADAVLPVAFYDDWVTVAAEEAEHHALLAARLADFGSFYGALPAHHGLWEAAAGTAHDLLARLAIVPLVLEARGLDVTPEMAQRLERLGDDASAAILRRIYADEIGHVAVGRRWFEYLCAARDVPPVATYHGLVRRHFKGGLKAPFNEAGRDAAGFAAAFYAPLAATTTETPPSSI
ncbi:MAG: hypothetical protein JWL84_5255 [Rhodospirillales bacterium]|jgi:uncharacterized ferritin-like protein (DUF455 family)|nr:hypothetical protein [Rhodospirillales bacterium]